MRVCFYNVRGSAVVAVVSRAGGGTTGSVVITACLPCVRMCVYRVSACIFVWWDGPLEVPYIRIIFVPCCFGGFGNDFFFLGSFVCFFSFGIIMVVVIIIIVFNLELISIWKYSSYDDSSSSTSIKISDYPPLSPPPASPSRELYVQQ